MKFQTYVNSDRLEHPGAVNNLKSILGEESSFQNNGINGSKPFLRFRNVFVRFPNCREVADFHAKHTNIPKIYCDGETVSYNTFADHSGPGFSVRGETSYYKPLEEPLPILLLTHRRLPYLKLALNSLWHSLKMEPDQKVFIVASGSDEPTINFLREQLDNKNCEVVVTENLGYAVGNFGIKWYKLDKFIHFEDDFILPEHTAYLYPYWTRQLNYRSTTADIVALRCSLENAPSQILKQQQKSLGSFVPSFSLDPHIVHQLWDYYPVDKGAYPPISGNGLVVNSKILYGSEQKPPRYCQTDMSYYQRSKTICLANLWVYHLGANQNMDGFGRANYADHSTIPVPPSVVKGVNLRTGLVRMVDLVEPYSSEVIP